MGECLPQFMLDTPRRQIPLRQTPPPPRAAHAGRYGQQAGGTHPTGMHSYYQSFGLWGVKAHQSRPHPSQSIFFSFSSIFWQNSVLNNRLVLPPQRMKSWIRHC